MKIRAVRLANVGRFVEPVALEGLSGGLDVLAGPNELGKSTLLRAMRTALSEKYSSKRKESVGVLQPYGGGSPRIEIDFEIGSVVWRIRKQFLSSASALLTNLDSGKSFRNADAEAELERLLPGQSDRTHFDLLWVEQGSSTAIVNPEGGLQTTLRDLVAAEVETIADGGAALRIRTAIAADLARYETETTKKPAREYATALADKSAAEKRLQFAKQKHDLAAGRLARLADVTTALQAIASRDVAAARESAYTAAGKRRDDAETARRHHELAVVAEQGARAQLERAGLALQTFEAQLKALASAEQLRDGLGLEHQRLDALDTELGAKRDAAERSLDEALRRKAETAAAYAHVEAAIRAADHASQARIRCKQLADAKRLDGQIRAIVAALAVSAATPERLAALRATQNELSALAARREASAPGIAISVTPAGLGRVRVAGRTAAAQENIKASMPTAIDIDGIATITVSPAQSDTETTERNRELDLRESMARALALVGATSVADAELALLARQAQDSERRILEAQLKALAPEGLASLAADVARLTPAEPAQAATPTQTADLPTLRATLQETTTRDSQDVTAAEQAVQPLRRSAAEAREQRITIAAKLESAQTQVIRLSEVLKDAAWRRDQLAVLQQETAALTALHGDKQREMTSWRQAVPDAATWQGIQSAVAAAKTTIDRSVVEERRLSEEVQNLEGQLIRDRDDDIASEVEAAQHALATASARVAAIERERAALTLLDRELRTAEVAGSNRIVAPILARIEPYLSAVVPKARLGISDRLQPVDLNRDGTREPIDRLSLGTREQIVVIVRLGFARLLAEGGAPVPLILDDALVYVDDQRIAAMFECLQQAAAAHQVIVLTCRERSFDRLGGHRLELKPWLDTAVVR